MTVAVTDRVTPFGETASGVATTLIELDEIGIVVDTTLPTAI